MPVYLNTDETEDWIKSGRWDLPYADADDADWMVGDMGAEIAGALARNEMPSGRAMPDGLRSAVLALVDG